jgi:hypothetical protein
MPGPPPNFCPACRYYVAGTCHRYPPVPDVPPERKWPLVGESDWCGEYQ